MLLLSTQGPWQKYSGVKNDICVFKVKKFPEKIILKYSADTQKVSLSTVLKLKG